MPYDGEAHDIQLIAVVENNSHSWRNAVATAMHLRSVETLKSIGANGRQNRSSTKCACQTHYYPYADARVQRIYGGSNEIMREIISRAL